MRRAALFLVALLLAPGTAHAQRRSDQARLSFGVGVGYNGATDVWSIKGQELFDSFARDTADFTRQVRPTIGLAFVGTYFPNDRLGFAAEAHLIGLGFEDGCTLRSNSGSFRNAAVCTDINGRSSPGTTVAATLGTLYRPFPWTTVQPYVRVNVGAVVSQVSAVRMRATIPTDTTRTDFVDVYVFQDEHPASVAPTGAVAGGFTAFVGRSYQLRMELKDNIVSLEHVTGTVASTPAEPTSERKIHHVFSMTIGLEVVLEKKRGRRY
ncbi:MAG TPA: hypothetical protein VG712_03480 [Gemmatimonadales bacterium]|nr:hypothetical protein [Gemmatimonadales bacterium]